MVAVLGGPLAPPPESSLHLALAAGPRHALPALLTAETPDRVPASNITGADDDGNNDQTNDEQAWKSNRSQNAVDKAAKNPVDG